MAKKAIAAWSAPSSRGTTTYEITLWDDNTSSCDCPGWVYAKGHERACKHTRELHYEMQRIWVQFCHGEIGVLKAIDTTPRSVLGERGRQSTLQYHRRAIQLD